MYQHPFSSVILILRPVGFCFIFLQIGMEHLYAETIMLFAVMCVPQKTEIIRVFLRHMPTTEYSV